jgi:hypothetical protein
MSLSKTKGVILFFRGGIDMDKETTELQSETPKNAQNIDELFGLERNMSLQSVNYATSGNLHLNERTESED